VALRFYRDLTIPEIAELVGARPGTVKSRLHHALRRLHDHLDRAEAQEALR
jgi:RNA polymerase sigma-70 factor (ECF subfamily)